MRARVLLVLLAACGGKERAREVVAPCVAPPDAVRGEATYYDADGSGRCSFEREAGAPLVAAVSRAGYADAASCGACAEVTGPDGLVVVRIVDRCDGCGPGDLDLSRAAFAQIAPLAAGRVPISWREVACDVTGPLRYRWKDGSSRFWAAIQVRNHRHPVASLAVRADDGSWRDLPRAAYNYFVATRPGLGKGPYTLRVTDARGQVVVDSGVELGDAVERAGAAQLEPCR